MDRSSEERRAALRRVFVLTATSVVASFTVTVVTMRLALGADPGATMSAAQALDLGMFFSVLVPTLVCPPLGYRASLLIRELNRTRNALQILAATDQLTGLLNRRGFDASASAALEAARDAGRPSAAMMCDIDHFKKLNDGFGHEFGDKCLNRVADVLRGIAEGRDFILGRQGGDEFVVLLPGVDLPEAAAIAERVRTACADTPFATPTGGVGLSVSIGVAGGAGAAASLSALLRRADFALYEVKRAGRNRVVVADLNEHWPSAA